jgi:hypothetical protein
MDSGILAYEYRFLQDDNPKKQNFRLQIIQGKPGNYRRAHHFK